MKVSQKEETLKVKETLLLADIRRGELNAPGEHNAPLRHLMSIGGLPQGATLIKKEARTLIGSRWTLAYIIPRREWWQSRGKPKLGQLWPIELIEITTFDESGHHFCAGKPEGHSGPLK